MARGALKETKREKAKRYREKRKEDAEKWQNYKKKEAERKREYRKRLSQQMESDSTLLRKYKEKNRFRQQVLRQKKKDNNNKDVDNLQCSKVNNSKDAKSKWRTLVSHLRNHMECVSQKQQRRYIPNTGNPDDQFVQLNDWKYYKEIEFVVPYMKNDTSNKSEVNLYGGRHMKATQHEITISAIHSAEDIIDGNNDKRIRNQNKEGNAGEIAKSTGCLADFDNSNIQEQHMTEYDEILREFFENMLKSTLNLPRLQQNRIKEKLDQAIKDQKGK